MWIYTLINSLVQSNVLYLWVPKYFSAVENIIDTFLA